MIDKAVPGKIIRDNDEVEVIPSLEERPPLEDVVRAVEIIAPKSKAESAKVEQFLVGIENAWKARAEDDETISFHEDKKGHWAVVRIKPDGSKELRYLREPGLKATLYCDARELANLVALGLVQDVPVVEMKPSTEEPSAEG